MHIEGYFPSPNRQAQTSWMPAAPDPVELPLSWQQPDLFVPSAEDDAHDAFNRATLARECPARWSRPPVSRGPLDARLLTAGPWDPVRVRPFPTDNPVLREAQRHLGRPYQWGGSEPSKGVDCSGYVYRVYKRSGRTVPLEWFRDTSVDPRVRPEALERSGMKHVRSPRPGDVVIFGRSHVGIYAGNVEGRPVYIGANHGGPGKRGRVDIMPVGSVGIRPVYYRYSPKKTRAANPDSRSNTVRTLNETSPPETTISPGTADWRGRTA